MRKNVEIELKQQKRGRPAQAISDERTRLVAEKILKGVPRNDIIEYCIDEFGVQRSTVQRQIHRANLYIRENYSVKPEDVVNIHIQKYYDIINQWDRVDGKTQIAAMQAIEKLLNLHKPETLMQNNTLNLNLKDLSMSELKELLKAKDE
jgi:3-methyladenine DNA glycosylase AlkC